MIKVKNIVIVGASHAAVETIASLRKLGWKDSITLVGDESILPYQRPPLSKGYLKGEIASEKLALRHPDFYKKNTVDLRLGHKATSIDRSAKLIQLDNGDIIKYDKLILATGTRPKYLSVEGCNLPQIKYLRTLADVDLIRESIHADTRLLVIGAGYIGLEVAASAIKQKAQVTIIEYLDRVLARVAGKEISDFYQKLHMNHGVDIQLNSSVIGFKEQNGRCLATLNNDNQIDFDCAVVGIGVEPNTELAENAGLKCNNGIAVDEYTLTNDSDIHAIGDCSNHPNFIYNTRVRLESVPNAVAQAKTAANYICGDKKAYDQVPWFWSDQYDIKLQTVGLSHGYDETIIKGNIEDKKFTVAYLKEGQMIALDAINSPKDFIEAKKIIGDNEFSTLRLPSDQVR